jgi:hypothetical protein
MHLLSIPKVAAANTRCSRQRLSALVASRLWDLMVDLFRKPVS